MQPATTATCGHKAGTHGHAQKGAATGRRSRPWAIERRRWAAKCCHRRVRMRTRRHSQPRASQGGHKRHYWPRAAPDGKGQSQAAMNGHRRRLMASGAYRRPRNATYKSHAAPPAPAWACPRCHYSGDENIQIYYIFLQFPSVSFSFLQFTSVAFSFLHFLAVSFIFFQPQ